MPLGKNATETTTVSLSIRSLEALRETLEERVLKATEMAAALHGPHGPRPPEYTAHWTASAEAWGRDLSVVDLALQHYHAAEARAEAEARALAEAGGA
jgi:predicted component of type VI protein secretion system